MAKVIAATTDRADVSEELYRLAADIHETLWTVDSAEFLSRDDLIFDQKPLGDTDRTEPVATGTAHTAPDVTRTRKPQKRQKLCGKNMIATICRPPCMGVGTNFGVGVEEARTEGPKAGMGLLGRGQQAHPQQLGFCGSVVSSLSGVRGGAPAAEGFSCILSRQIAFPSISVRVAYSLHG